MLEQGLKQTSAILSTLPLSLWLVRCQRERRWPSIRNTQRRLSCVTAHFLQTVWTLVRRGTLRIHQLRTNRNQLRSLENYCSRNCLIEQNYDLKS